MDEWKVKIKRACSLVITNPGALYNFFRKLIWSNLFPPKSGDILVNGIVFNIDLKLDSAMKDMYYGTYQAEVISVLKKYLHPGDVFIDIGANVGYVSTFALGCVGKNGEVHSFEPVPKYFERLKYVKDKNAGHHIFINNVALGEKEKLENIAVTNLANIGWNTLVPGFMPKDTIGESVEVKVSTLDKYLSLNKIDNVRLIKIDVEGYEFPVLKGAQQYFQKTKRLPILLVEVAPSAYPNLKLSLSELGELMASFGYTAYGIDFKEKINIAALVDTTDVVFLPRN